MTVTLKDKFQIVVPPSLQRQAGFKRGDQLEFRASRGVIMIVPKSEPISPLIEAFHATQEEARQNGANKLTMKQINAEIAACRKEKRRTATEQRAK